MTNTTKSWMVMSRVTNEELTGEWCRVIERTPTKLTISIHGIELPNVQCVYVHYRRVPITEEQAEQHPELYNEWQELQKSFDQQYPPCTIHAISKDARDEATLVISPRSNNQTPMIHILGYNIDIEDGQTNLYWYDGKASMNSDHHIMRRIACPPTSNSPEKPSTVSPKSTHPNKTSTKSSKPS